MNCTEFEKQIVLFTELTGDELTKLTAHLKTCKTCSGLFESVDLTNNLIGRASKVNLELEDPFRLTNDIMARIRIEESRQWSLFNLSLLTLEFKYLKYAMATLSFLLVAFFGIEQFQSPATSEGVSKNESKKIVLSRKSFQELNKSRAALNLSLANRCKSPFYITKVNTDCLKQRIANK
jgi:hypothetical protein